MIDICCKHLKRRTDFRFLAVHTCVISIMFLTNHGGSTSTAMSTATVHATTRLHLQMYYQSRPMDGGRLRWPVSPYPRIPVTAACGADRYTAHWSSHMRKRHASCKPSKVYPTHWQGFTAIANATHACESSRDGRSMIWHAAVFSYTKTDRNCASLGIMVEAGA
jgi:hypothetical protein